MLIIRDHASLRDLDVQDDAWIEQNDLAVQAGIASAADPGGGRLRGAGSHGSDTRGGATTSGSVLRRIEPNSGHRAPGCTVSDPIRTGQETPPAGIVTLTYAGRREVTRGRFRSITQHAERMFPAARHEMPGSEFRDKC
jgi:hypothetical protein